MTILNRQERADKGPVAVAGEVFAANLMRAPVMEREAFLDRLASALLPARAAEARGGL